MSSSGEFLESIEKTIEMWQQGRKVGEETIIELLYKQSKVLAEIIKQVGDPYTVTPEDEEGD